MFGRMTARPLRSLLHFAAVFLVACCARSDVVVVFNEIMYHPLAPNAAEEEAREWIELRNQMAVDIDLSGWSLAGGINFTFPQNTILPRGSQLVVAANPAVLQAVTGFVGAFGPWTGKLGNDGENLELRNKDDRVMDQLSYGTDGGWASGPDGGGTSLAKRTENLASDDSRSWRESLRVGGTPGAENFPAFQPPTTHTLLEANGAWVFRADGADLGTGWRAQDASEAGWSQGNAAFQLGSAPLPAPAVAGTALPGGPVTYYFRRRFDYAGQPLYTRLRLRLLVDDGAAVFLNGTEVARANLAPSAGATIPATNPRRSAPAWREFDLPGGLLQPTGNVLAAELHQAATLPSYAAAVLGSAPVAYWRLDENSALAGAAGDLAHLPDPPEQGDQNGTMQGFAAANLAAPGPRPSDTIAGQPLLGFEPANAAPAFQGNNDGGNDVALFPGSAPLNFALSGHKFSAEAWIKGVPTQESGAAIFAKGNGGGGEQFALDLVTNRFRFFVRDPAGTVALFQHGSLGPNNTWQHVAVTYDPATNTMRMFVNGTDVGGGTPRPTLMNNSVDVSVGARRLGGGPYDLNFNGTVDEVAFFNRALSAAEIAQHYNAAFSASPVGADTSDAVFAAELIATQTLPFEVVRSFVLNEVAISGVELINLGPAASTAGLALVRVTSSGVISTPVPPQDVPANGFAPVPLALSAGDRVLLLAADGVTVLDSFEVKSTPRSRSPDGTGAWLRPVALTPGAANQVVLNRSVVINEIMFDPPADAYFAAGTPRAGQWIELHNSGAAPVDLTGWSFDDGVSFTFPATIIPAGSYVVVAENPAALISAHGLSPAQVFGPWSGNLSRRGERLELLDAVGNPADEIRYASGGRWPETPNGGGSSLELRQPLADNAVPESWAGSDESSKADWQTFTWRGANVPSQTGEPTLWRELNLLLMDGPGECLVDDVRVTDMVTGTNLVQNGDFNAGAAKWRLLGNHRGSRVESESGGNQVLRLIASGPGEYQGNQIETTFVGNQALVAGREYEISLRARWLSGGGRLNARLYFNRIPRTNILAMVPNGGTPGAVNSQATANLGPALTHLRHAPVVPEAGQPVAVSVIAADPDGIGSLDIKYSVNGGTWQTVPMAAGENGLFTASLPGQPAAARVQFYVEARDMAGSVSNSPARGPSSRALYVVQDGQATGALPGFRLVMTSADAIFLHTPVNTLSNEFLGATVIVGERDVYYDVGVRLKGSFVGRNVPRVGFTVRFGPDALFRGVLDKVGVDRSQHTAISVGEIITKQIALAGGGIPGMYDDLARFIHPLGTYTSNAALRLAGFDEEYLDSQFQNGADGEMFEFEVIRWNLATIDGNPESPKLPGNESGGTGYANLEVQDWGNNQEAYRWTALQLMNRDEDDYSGLIALEKLFSQNGATFATNAAQQLDVDSWLRTLAYQTLVGPADAAFTGSNIHNFRFYFRANDRRAMYLPWDWDSSFQRATSAPLIGGGNLSKVATASADLTRRYYAHVYHLIRTSFNTAYMSRWTQHYGALAGEDFSSTLAYIGNRAAFAQAQLPTGTPFTANPGTVASDGTVVITGTANIAIAFIEVNGVWYVPVWISNTAWRIVVPLGPGDNTLNIIGIDFDGQPVAGATSTVTVNNPFNTPLPALKINEWLAENDGAFRDANGGADDWFEIYNPTGAPVNLAGWKLTDAPGGATPFVVPNGWTIPAGGFLLVWADNETAQNPATPAAGSALHASFRLGNNGDTIQLAGPAGHVVDLVTFGAQRANRAEGRFPDGAPARTGLTLPTPGTANALTVVTPLTLGPAGGRIQFTTTPGLRYTLQRSANLLAWENVAPAQVATGSELTIDDDLPAGTERFYRVLVSP